MFNHQYTLTILYLMYSFWFTRIAPIDVLNNKCIHVYWDVHRTHRQVQQPVHCDMPNSLTTRIANRTIYWTISCHVISVSSHQPYISSTAHPSPLQKESFLFHTFYARRTLFHAGHIPVWAHRISHTVSCTVCHWIFVCTFHICAQARRCIPFCVDGCILAGYTRLGDGCCDVRGAQGFFHVCGWSLLVLEGLFIYVCVEMVIGGYLIIIVINILTMDICTFV